MPAPRPYTLVAELSYQCPLHCPYCSNPVDIGGERWRAEPGTEHLVRAFREARALGVLQPAPTRGAAQGGRPGPRAGLDPEPRPRGERPDRRDPLVRQEDRRRSGGAGAWVPADDQLRPASPEP